MDISNEIFDKRFYESLQNIKLNLSHRITSGVSGGRKSKLKGSSIEFSDFREYSLGDDFRRIDWNAYGRFDKLFVKLFMEEREVLTNIFIDCSKSMDFGENKKSDLALKIAAILSYISLNNQDQVKLHFINDKEIITAPNIRGKMDFSKVLFYLSKLKFSGICNLDLIMKNRFTSKGFAVVISDFLSNYNVEGIIKYLVYKKQQFLFLNILCEEELRPDLFGEIRLIDSENLATKDVSISPSSIKEYLKALDKFMSTIKEMCKKYGGSYELISTSNSLDSIIFDKLFKTSITMRG